MDSVLGQPPPTTMLSIDHHHRSLSAGGVALQSQQLQKVIQAQRSQIALLKEINQYVSKTRVGDGQPAPPPPSTGHFQGAGFAAPREDLDVGNGRGRVYSNKVVRTDQSYDDLNDSDKKAQHFRVVKQMEKARYFEDDRWP